MPSKKKSTKTHSGNITRENTSSQQNNTKESAKIGSNVIPVLTGSIDADQRKVKRLLDFSVIYMNCEILCYDEKLHRSVDNVIEQLESLQQNTDTTDELLGNITERHLALLNQRMKLLKFRPDYLDKLSITRNKTKKQKLSAQSDIDINVQCVFCKEDHSSESCAVLPWSERLKIIKRKKRCYKCLGKFTQDHQCSQKCSYCNREHHISLCERSAKRFLSKTPKDLTKSSFIKPDATIASTSEVSFVENGLN